MGGTCTIYGCDESRNAACSDRYSGDTGKCVCKRNTCAHDGKCSPQQWGCPVDTGGTCRAFGCDKTRNAKCYGSACLCEKGFCAQGGTLPTGRCVPASNATSHDVALVTGQWQSRGMEANTVQITVAMFAGSIAVA